MSQAAFLLPGLLLSIAWHCLGKLGKGAGGICLFTLDFPSTAQQAAAMSKVWHQELTGAFSALWSQGSQWGLLGATTLFAPSSDVPQHGWHLPDAVGNQPRTAAPCYLACGGLNLKYVKVQH